MSKALEAARKAAKAKRESGEAIARKNPFEKWKDNPNSLRKIVNAMCWQCAGGGHDAGTIERIRTCKMDMHSICPCPCFYKRPYQ